MRQTKVGGFDQQARQLSNRLDLHLLELFDSVYRMRNLTAAGEALGLSQPAVSRGLARLRDAYDDPLFIRQPRGVLATPLAEHLAAPLAQALAIVHGTVERPIFNPATDTRHFHVSMTDIGERFFLPRLFNHLANVAPAVTVEAVSQSPPELQAGLPSGDIDLVAGFLPALGKQVRRTRLFHERFIYIARQGHPMVQGRLSREQLHDLPHVVASPPGTRHASHVERALASPLVQARVALRVRSFLCVAPIVSQTDLVAAVPSNLAALMAPALNLQIIDPPIQIEGFDVTMAWHDRFQRDPASEWLREQFLALFKDLDLVKGAIH